MAAVTPHAEDHGGLGPLASRYVQVDALPWTPTRFPGVEIKVLMEDRETGLLTALTRLAPGAVLPLHEHTDLEQTWVPDAATERRRRLVARRNQLVRHRTRVKNEIHAILAAHLVPPCPHAELFNRPGRAWLARQAVPEDEGAAIERHLRELDRLG